MNMENEFYINEIDLNNYEKIKNIGFGSYAYVYEVKDKKTGNLFAAKILNRIDTIYETKEDFLKRFKRETDILYNIKHPCILSYHGVSFKDFDGHKNPMIFTEYEKNGSLHQMLKLKSKDLAPIEFDDTMKYIIMYGIAKGMEFLHGNGIIHRDLKTLNILLNDNFYPIIADFGLAKAIDPADPKYQSTYYGTVLYQAPEIINCQEFSNLVDVYAYGIILYEIITELEPYTEIQNKGCIGSYVTEKNYRPKLPDIEINDKIKSLMEECWDSNPEKRPEFANIASRLEQITLIQEMDIDEVRFEKYCEFIKLSHQTFISGSPFTPYKEANEKINQVEGEIYSFDDAELSKEAQDIIDKAIDGDNESMYITGISFYKGLSPFYKDCEKGMQYLNKAKAMGSIEAHLSLAEIYYQNEDFQNSIELLSAQGVKEHPKAKLIMAKIKLKEPNPDYLIIKKYLQEASLDSNAEAMVLYGKLLMKNTKMIKRDFSTSFKYFKIASELNDSEAKAYLALFYYYGFGVIDFDFKKAAELSRLSYEQKNMTGAALFAECLSKGRGIEKNEELAIKIAKESSEHNNSKGKNKYGEFLNIGLNGIQVDKKKAMKLFKESMEQGDEEGKFLYASCLLEGTEYGLDKEPTKAVQLLKESIEEGCISAMATYGQLQIRGCYVNDDYLDSIFSDQNIIDGIDNIKDAANLGNDYGIIIYCQILANRIGPDLDSIELQKYLEIGLKRKNLDCELLYNKLYKQRYLLFPISSSSEFNISDNCCLEEEEYDQNCDDQYCNDQDSNSDYKRSCGIY